MKTISMVYKDETQKQELEIDLKDYPIGKVKKLIVAMTENMIFFIEKPEEYLRDAKRLVEE